MYLSKVFNIELYKFKVYFYIVSDIKKKVKLIENKTNGEWIIPYDGGAGGLSFSLDVDKYYIIIRQDAIQHYYISHEIQHVIDDVTKHRGEEETSRAYLNGFLTQKIHDLLKQKNIKVG